MMSLSSSTAKPITVASAPDWQYDHRNQPLFNDSVHIFVPFFVGPWIMHACYPAASYHLGITRTRKILEHFFSWVIMEVSTKWWVRHCLRCRKIFHQTVHWPTFSIPLPKNLGIFVSVDYFGSLPIKAQSNFYILLFTNRSSRRSNMSPVVDVGFTTEGPADSLVNRLIPL